MSSRIYKALTAFLMYEMTIMAVLMPFSDDRMRLRSAIRVCTKFEDKYGAGSYGQKGIYYKSRNVSLEGARALLEDKEATIAFWERLSPPHLLVKWLLRETNGTE